ncbi:transposase [Cryobacterium sp. Sr3]|nr:transposase [Cryobacterium sp. Sr3]
MFTMARSLREFTPEFKDEANKLVINTGRAVATVSRELGVNEATLGRWVNLFKSSQVAGEGGVTETEKVELLRLRNENSDLKLDRAFLKKPSSSSPRKPRIRTPSVRTDAGGKTNFSIVRMGCLLVVSRSGYYARLGRSPSGRAVQQENIEQKVARFHSDSNEVYGPRSSSPTSVPMARSSPARPWLRSCVAWTGGHQPEILAHHHGQPSRGRLPRRRRQTAVGYRGPEPGF